MPLKESNYKLQIQYPFKKKKHPFKNNNLLRFSIDWLIDCSGGAPGRTGSGCFKLPRQPRHFLAPAGGHDVKVVSPPRRGLKMPSRQQVAKNVPRKVQKKNKMHVMQPTRGVKAVKKGKGHAVKQSRQSKRPCYMNA